MLLLSASIQDHHLNTIVNCSNLLQINYLQIDQQASVLKSTLQAQPNIYSSSCPPPQKQVTSLPPPMKPEHLLLILRPHIM